MLLQSSDLTTPQRLSCASARPHFAVAGQPCRASIGGCRSGQNLPPTPANLAEFAPPWKQPGGLLDHETMRARLACPHGGDLLGPYGASFSPHVPGCGVPSLQMPRPRAPRPWAPLAFLPVSAVG